MNEIIFDGRLTRDPEYKTGKKKGGDGDYSLASICIANDDYDKKARKGEEAYEPNWIPVKLWGRNADFVQKFCRKGTRVVIKGKLETDKYKKDDQYIYTWGIENAKVEFIDWSTVPDELRGNNSTNVQPSAQQPQRQSVQGQPQQQRPQQQSGYNNQGYQSQPQTQQPQGQPQQSFPQNAVSEDNFDFGSFEGAEEFFG